MLLTLPVLFAFYAMLSVAIELRGAPFVGWIHDLSAHDPLYITPILMGVTMFVQQRMTPSTADPVQQKMMMFMPLVFTSMFLLGAERARALLDGEQPLGDRSAGADEPADRRAGAARDGGGRSTSEERRRRTHRAGGKGAEVMDLHERVREFMQQTLRRHGSAPRRRGHRRRLTVSGSSSPATAASSSFGDERKRSMRCSTS